MATFKARARALDMLGRQQIAGIPTAISELFKNAHDAYATRVDVDFYRWSQQFILRDDGIGMTRADFEQRWLTLGTESKIGSSTLAPPPARGTPRPVMGEKGIGRLAIGIIGPQVLVLTRADRPGEEHPIVAAFINWSAFALPGINLDQVQIPIREFPDVPDEAAVREMVASFRESLDEVGSEIDAKSLQSVLHELDSFSINPLGLQSRMGAPSLAAGGCGTHFYISPADDSLIADLEGTGESGASSLVRLLIGFTDTMTRGHSAPVIVPQFRDHRTPDSFVEMIGPGSFWSPEEINKADHSIAGEFDAFGQFSGKIRIFNNPEVEHVIPWAGARGRQTDCGSFRIDLGVLQGATSDTLLPAEQYAVLRAKSELIAGVYVYRDGLRVLPYGNNDYDWLDIEKRRTKSARYYYFSYRNLYGAILIGRGSNSALVEKAGREGFQENKAYRQLRAILNNFFMQIAADFFRSGSATAEPFLEQKEEFDRILKARLTHEKKVTELRRDLEQDIDEFFDRKPFEFATREAAEIANDVELQAQAATMLQDPGYAAESLIRLEATLRKRLAKLKDDLTVRKPRGLVLRGALREAFERYENESTLIERAVLVPLREKVDQLVTQAIGSRRLDVDRRLRIERSLAEIETETRREVSGLAKDVGSSADEVKVKIEKLSRETVAQLEREVREVEVAFASTDLSALPDDLAVEARIQFESRLRTAAEVALEGLGSIRDQLASLGLERDDQGRIVGGEDLRIALEEQLAALQERSDADIELSQMGMAIDVINHEFEGSVKAIRENLRRLKSWADLNVKLGGVYRDLSGAFQHLDGYLRLFTPLQRRLYRSPIEISGADIAKYIRDVFRKRMESEKVQIRATRRFMEHKVIGYPSTFYPVFVNLVDNALFWVKDRPEPRQILLDAPGETMIVSDSGPGIADRDLERLFVRGFTRKPSGRGLGLYVSKEVLDEVGFSLSAVPDGPLPGATFEIRPKGDEE